MESCPGSRIKDLYAAYFVSHFKLSLLAQALTVGKALVFLWEGSFQSQTVSSNFKAEMHLLAAAGRSDDLGPLVGRIRRCP